MKMENVNIISIMYLLAKGVVEKNFESHILFDKNRLLASKPGDIYVWINYSKGTCLLKKDRTILEEQMFILGLLTKSYESIKYSYTLTIDSNNEGEVIGTIKEFQSFDNIVSFLKFEDCVDGEMVLDSVSESKTVYLSK